MIVEKPKKRTFLPHGEKKPFKPFAVQLRVRFKPMPKAVALFGLFEGAVVPRQELPLRK